MLQLISEPVSCNRVDTAVLLPGNAAVSFSVAFALVEQAIALMDNICAEQGDCF